MKTTEKVYLFHLLSMKDDRVFRPRFTNACSRIYTHNVWELSQPEVLYLPVIQTHIYSYVLGIQRPKVKTRWKVKSWSFFS